MIRVMRLLPVAVLAGALFGQAALSGQTSIDPSQADRLSPDRAGVNRTPAAPSRKLVTIAKLSIKGTRFPARSIQILTGLREGDQIDEVAVREAIARMLESGLIRSVDYNYESLEDAHRVLLELHVIDETPLFPASIEIPGVDPESVWTYLESVDPLFTRELPRTQKALRFYTHAISDYLHTNRRADSLVPIVTGDDAEHPTGIVFAPRRPRSTVPPGSRRTG